MFIIAYPDALRAFATQAEAEKFADTIREFRHVKVFDVKEVAHLFPKGKPGPKDPGPPGTPAAGTEVLLSKVA